MRSPLSGSGPAVLGAQLIIWVALRRAEQQKSSKYSDVVVPGICKLLTLATESGGRNNGTVNQPCPYHPRGGKEGGQAVWALRGALVLGGPVLRTWKERLLLQAVLQAVALQAQRLRCLLQKKPRTAVEMVQELSQLKGLKDAGILHSPKVRDLKAKILSGD